MSKKTYKRLIILAVIVMSVILTGCVEINIIGEIDPYFMVTYRGDIELNLSGFQYSQQTLAQENMIQLCEYWQEIGYECQVAFDDEIYSIYFQKQVQCQSYDEAFKVLFDMMTDEYTAFTSLSYAYTPYENYSDYAITGSMDISNALDMDVYNALNDSIKTTVSDEMQNLNANIKFVLPNQDNISQSPTLTKTYTAQIKADDVTDFVFQGRIYNPNISAETKDIINNFNNYNKLSYVLGGILAILLILTIITIVKIKKK